MRTVTDLPISVIEEADASIVLSDGCRLSARIWRAETDRPVPAVLEYIPYRKRDGTAVRDALTHPYVAGHGYACVRVDVRGNGASDGLMEDEYTPQELTDACEIIAWLAAQPWCNGSVGMMGISWGGFNSLQVAALRPPALKAIITLCSTVDRFRDDIHYLLNENLGWGATMWSYSSRAPDPELDPAWRDAWIARLEAEPFLPPLWLSHQRRDAYWRHGSVCEDYGAISARVLAVGGWGDSYRNTVPTLVDNVAGAQGIVGPWIHKYPHFAVPGPRIGFLQVALRWWDRWLKGVANGVEDDPAYRVYLMDGVRPSTWYTERPGRWLALPGWPAPGIGSRRMELGPGRLGEAGTFRTLVASPQHCGMAGGEFCAIWLGPEMPGDQRADDAYSACFDSAPQPATAIVGAPVVRLRVAADQAQANVVVRLSHVHPDGAATRITWGLLNLAHRDGHEAPEALVPGAEVEVEIALDHVAYALPEGHRLRVAVSSSYWPMIWPSPRPVALTLTGGSLDLPVLDVATAAPCTFPAAESSAPLKLVPLRQEGHVRRTEIDERTGLVTLVIEDDFGLSKDPEHGLVSGGVGRERWTIHPDDPLSAHGECHWTAEMQRGDISIRTEARCAMWSDATHFHLSADLEAFEGDKRVLSRKVEYSIRRDHL
jgi:predicted acyl esterase